MTHERLTSLCSLRQKWEEDLGEDIPEKAWAGLIERAWKSTRNARFQLVHFFILHRAYLTPAKINRLFKINTAMCPRCNTLGADFSHMMWGCPQLGTYWEEVVALLQDITTRDIKLTIGLCLLHWFPHTTKNKVTSKFIDLGLLLAKREITLHWKAQKDPSFRRWQTEGHM